MFSLRRRPSSPLLFRQRARPTPTYKTNIITNPATNTINLATNLLQISSIWQQIPSIWQQISREGCTNKWETRFVVASYPKRDFWLQVIRIEICCCILPRTRFLVPACLNQDVYLDSSLGRIPHEIYGLEWNGICNRRWHLKSDFNQMCLPLFSSWLLHSKP